jgi:hypothetical protein
MADGEPRREATHCVDGLLKFRFANRYEIISSPRSGV